MAIKLIFNQWREQMKTVRELTRKGDPRLNVFISAALKAQIETLAKQNRRRFQDEIIKRLAATLRLGINISECVYDEDHADAEKICQVIPREMLNALEQHAEAKQNSLDMEVAERLKTTLAKPNDFGFSPLLSQILHQKIKPAQYKNECTARQNAWLNLYQSEKLKLYLEFKKYLPKHFNEGFSDTHTTQPEINPPAIENTKNTKSAG